LALGLNSTQGITDVADPGRLLDQIVEALDYNGVPKSAPSDSLAAPFLRKPKMRLDKFLNRHVAKIVPILLALSVLGLVVLAVASRPPAAPPLPPPASQAAPPKPEPSMRLEAAEYAPGQTILPTLSGLDSSEAYGRTILGWAPAGSDPSAVESPIFPEGPRPSLEGPQAPGDYEVRWYLSPERADAETLAAAAPITVVSSAWGAFEVSVEKLSFAPGEAFQVQVKGAPSSMIADRAMVGLYRPESAGDEFLYYINVDRRDEALNFDAPKEPGAYEIRAYSTNRAMTPDVLVAVIAVAVQ
jgi:hypothetical protein